MIFRNGNGITEQRYPCSRIPILSVYIFHADCEKDYAIIWQSLSFFFSGGVVIFVNTHVELPLYSDKFKIKIKRLEDQTDVLVLQGEEIIEGLAETCLDGGGEGLDRPVFV